jgi:hypothetical protein
LRRDGNGFTPWQYKAIEEPSPDNVIDACLSPAVPEIPGTSAPFDDHLMANEQEQGAEVANKQVISLNIKPAIRNLTTKQWEVFPVIKELCPISDRQIGDEMTIGLITHEIECRRRDLASNPTSIS